ncbi:MAG: bifunctional oligoribonuclease and phosphatase NrnA [Desulfovibrionales bacterium]|jgi:phosphoesterase RecJ-like protein|nr:bifunctional oligoribonuclease and phosphatase NrnA [Desulfovibrionales bacterium]
MDSPASTIAELIRTEDDFLVAAHANPDGDALGSTVALGHLLRFQSKRFHLYNYTGMTAACDWLNPPAPVHTSLPSWKPRVCFILDCGALDRVGEELLPALDACQVVNVDHHIGNPAFGDLNWVDSSFSAVGEMISQLARELGAPLQGDLAEAVYLAIATDTHFFTYASATPRTLRLAAEMVENGLELGEVNGKIRNQWSLNRITLWTRIMQNLRLDFGGRVAMAAIPQELYRETGTSSLDSDDLVSFLRRIRGVRIAALLREDEPEKIKFSLRSQGADNVRDIAALFGGGGHKNASGGTIWADLEQAKEQLVHTVGEQMGFI